MRDVLPGRLWIGNAADGRNAECLLQSGVAAVMNLAAEEPSPVLPRSMIYCRFPLVDGAQDYEGALSVAIQTLTALLRNQVPTLVYCGAGMSRSPAVAAAALAIVEGGSPEERLRRIVAGQPHDISPQFWEAVRTICLLHQGADAAQRLGRTGDRW
jgi:protein-tyrosine phosphatase